MKGSNKMARKKTFAVIGLGRFGKAVLNELMALDNEVLAIDIDEASVNDVVGIASHALICDATEEEQMLNIGIKNIDHVVVAIGVNVQASILTALILKELNVKHITVKANNLNHERVLRKIGIDDIIHPEADMGKRIARRISSRIISETLELSKTYSLIEIKASSKVFKRSLAELDLRGRMGINIVAIKRGDEILVPHAKDLIQENDVLVVVGSNLSLDKFEKHLESTF
jgi:trk system potassium uptake protein TrkA